MKKKSSHHKNLMLFDDFDDDDFFDFSEENMKEALKRLEVLMDGYRKPAAKPAVKPAFKIPPAKATDARWIMPGEKITFGSYKITAGFFYFGTSMPSDYDDSRNFASLVNPNISIPKKKKLDPKQNMVPSVIDYAELTGIQRRKYIVWLCGGRTGENIHDWFALLFLYGLERRVFMDGVRGIVKDEEFTNIRDEAKRILKLYGDKSNPVRAAYSNFLAYFNIERPGSELYNIPFPYFECKRYKEDSVFAAYINTALLQCAEDGVPVNPDIAYCWYILAGDIRRSDIAVTCEEKFKELFIIRYAETYEKGIPIKTSKKKDPEREAFYYQPASTELDKETYAGEYEKAAISGQKSHINKLISIAERCEIELTLYADRLKKNGAVEAMLTLPPVLWTGVEAVSFAALKRKLQSQRYLTEIDELKITFFKNVPISRASLIDFAYALETENIGIEPDIISFPDAIDVINGKFMFHTLKGDVPQPRSNITYSFCRRVTELAVSAYRQCKPAEQTFKWYVPVQLDDYYYDRVISYVMLLIQYPPPLQQCIKNLKSNGKGDKEYIIEYIRDRVLEDCNTGYEGVAVLEKLYKGFGFTKKELYSELHCGGVPAAKNADISLDKDKIQQLREDSDHVYTMLSDIFKDGDAESTPSKPDSKKAEDGGFGFDETQILFLKTILSRPEWRREELSGMAREHGLMLDGFIEIVNETAYNEFDEALIEGDEIITVNTDISEMMMEKL
ncbi:MAG: TerB N-terminal domain-containing protein [Spirochaetaceae bacterium]|jgi:hypothetical protein|nr:TerB N-terminal domain-containing protein [Spirochaetaceae bacterium]